MTEETKVKMSEEQFYGRSLNIHNEIEMLKVDLKELKEEFVEEGNEKPRATEIQAVAKLVAECKEHDAILKAKQKIETITEFTDK